MRDKEQNIMENGRLRKQLDFIVEADKEKRIERITHITGHIRPENDAEHAWHMALMTYLLAEYSDEPIDIAKTMAMCLIHDIVEIDAGDTYAYDEEGKKTQAEREAKAADRIYGLLPEDQNIALRSLFEEFEERKTPEARFARLMDNLQPLLLNVENGGGDWTSHHVKAEQVKRRNEHNAESSKALADFVLHTIDEQKRLGRLE